MPHRALKIIGITLLLLILSLVWLLFQPPEAIVLVRDSRQGLGAGSAFFSITNPTHRAASLILSKDPPLLDDGSMSVYFRVEKKLQDHWTSERTRPAMYPGCHWLDPGQAVNFKADLSTNQTPQRIVVFWQFEDRFWRPRSRTLPVWFTKIRGLYFKTFGTRFRTATSEEISANHDT